MYPIMLIWAWVACLQPSGFFTPHAHGASCISGRPEGQPPAGRDTWAEISACGSAGPLIVQFPCDVTVSCVQGLDPKATGSVLRTGGCGVVGVAYSDQKFVVTDACYKIFRTWTVQTWCSYQPEGTSVYPTALVDPSTNRITFTSAIDSLILQRNIGIGQRVTLRYVTSGTTEIPGMTEGDVYSLIRVSDSTFTVAYNTTKQEPVSITGTGVGPHLFRYANSDLGLPLSCGQLQQYPFENWYSACCGPGQNRAWQDDGDGYLRFTQVIKVIDDVAPQWVDCSDLTFCHEQSDCGLVAVALTGLAGDECTPQGQLKYSWQLDLFNDGTINGTGATADASGSYPPGTHKVTFKVTDQCGNWNTCTRQFTILDCKKPTPVCLHNLSVNLMETPDGGMAEVWASSLESGDSYDNCTPYGQLTILVERVGDLLPGQSVPGAGAGASVIVTCDDLPPHTMSPLAEVAIWVGDAAGNWDYCLTSIWVQDNMGACAMGNATALLAHVATPDQQGLPGVALILEGDLLAQGATNPLGYGHFGGLPLGGQYRLQPFRDDELLLGVTALDLALLEKHVLGVRPLTDPYLLIAADVNKDGRISHRDIQVLRRAILDPALGFPGNTSWRFTEAAYVFPDPTRFDRFPEAITFTELAHGQMARFTGIKIGDLSGDAWSGSKAAPGLRQAGRAIVFDSPDQRLEPGRIIEVVLRADQFRDVSAFQLTLDFDISALQLLDIEPVWEGLRQDHFGQSRAGDGLISMCWHAPHAMDLAQGTALFVMRFLVLAKGNLQDKLQIGSGPVPALAYGARDEALDLRLSFRPASAEENAGEAYVLSPNPFRDRTRLAFHLAQEGEVTFTVFDRAGTRVYSHRGRHSAGTNQFDIHRRDLPGSGLYYFLLDTGQERFSGSMVVQD